MRPRPKKPERQRIPDTDRFPNMKDRAFGRRFRIFRQRGFTRSVARALAANRPWIGTKVVHFTGSDGRDWYAGPLMVLSVPPGTPIPSSIHDELQSSF